MEPLELAVRNYSELSPVQYLQGTHDARIHDVAFDGETLVLVSESWVGTDPIEPAAGQNFWVIFSRYRATFKGVDGFCHALRERDVTIPDTLKHLMAAADPGPPTLADFMEEEILNIKIALPHVTIETDGHELRFTCRSFDVQRFPPTKEDYR